jgi:DNA-binding GntR family transcriptional regulator
MDGDMIPSSETAILPVLGAPQRIVDTVHAAIRQAIMEGQISAGSALSVPDLSRKLNVSRSPVREAVLQLVADGLALEIPRKGVVVKEIALEDLRQIHEIREALEGLAARLAAQSNDHGLPLALIETLDAQARAIVADDGKAFYETDRRFHDLIAGCCGNARLAQMQASLRMEMSLALIKVASSPDHAKLALEEHHAIAQAIAAGNGDAAEATMKAHIRATRLRLVRVSGGRMP